MNWTDTAITLRAMRTGKTGVALSLLSARHGRCQGRLVGEEAPEALPGSRLEIAYTQSGIGEPGSIEATELDPGFAGAEGAAPLVMRIAASLIHGLFELGEPLPRLYEALSAVAMSMIWRKRSSSHMARLRMWNSPMPA